MAVDGEPVSPGISPIAVRLCKITERPDCLQPLLLSLVALAIHLPTFGQPLVERAAFRQTQTAFAAHLYQEQGIDLLHPLVPVLGPPWQMTFEFPLFQAAAALVMDFGVTPETALRAVSFASFLATGILLWGLLRWTSGTATATAALAVFLFSPFGLLWSRTSMIEFAATAGAIGFVWAALVWRERRSRKAFALALVAGSVAMLVKATTAAYWILPFALLGFKRDPNRPLLRYVVDPGAWALVLIPLALGLAWTAYADAVKAASPTTASLTSTALVTWNFGTLAQRFDPMTWLTVIKRLALLGGWLLPIVVLVIPLAARQRTVLFWVWIIAAAVLPIATFTNLYVVHDYYFAAISPAIAALVGGGFGALVQLWPRHAPRAAITIVVISSIALFIARSYWLPMYATVSDPEHILPRALQIRAQTQSGDLVAINASAWNPALLYYAGRWGTQVSDGVSALPGFVVFTCTPWNDPVPRCVPAR